MANEITISWDKSPTPGATYNVYRGTALGNESPLPYAVGIVAPSNLALSSVAAAVAGNTAYAGTITGGDLNAFAGMKVTISGFLTPANNVVGATVVSSTATSLVVENAGGVVEVHAGLALPRPYFIDNAVNSGSTYSYEITAVIAGIESTDSLQILAPMVPFPPSPVALNLGLASSFEILAGSAVTNTGTTTAAGDVGVSPGTSITGFGPPSSISGAFHIADFVAFNAQAAATAAFVAGNALPGGIVLSGDIGGQVLPPGVYESASSLAITGTLTLDAGGNPDAVWVFQIGSTLTTASGNSNVEIINGGRASNVFWLVGSSATLTGTSEFRGNIIAQTAVSVGTAVVVEGRLFALTAAVTTISDDINLNLAVQVINYNHVLNVLVGQVFFEPLSHSFQQAIVGGTTGAVTPVFSGVLGALTVDGSVTWVTIQPVVLSPLPPSPPNVPPAPPAAPTNPSVSSET